MAKNRADITPMDIWGFLAPLILEFEKGNEHFNQIYVTTYHALKLEEEWRKENGESL